MSRIKQNKILISFFVILVIFLFILSFQKVSVEEVVVENSVETQASENAQDSLVEVANEEIVADENSFEILSEKENNNLTTESFELTIVDQKITVYFIEGETLYDALINMRESDQINFEEKKFSGLGVFIYSINGIEQKNGSKYWIYYINGKEANIGVSNYVLKKGDEITWKLENNEY